MTMLSLNIYKSKTQTYFYSVHKNVQKHHIRFTCPPIQCLLIKTFNTTTIQAIIQSHINQTQPHMAIAIYMKANLKSAYHQENIYHHIADEHNECMTQNPKCKFSEIISSQIKKYTDLNRWISAYNVCIKHNQIRYLIDSRPILAH